MVHLLYYDCGLLLQWHCCFHRSPRLLPLLPNRRHSVWIFVPTRPMLPVVDWLAVVPFSRVWTIVSSMQFERPPPVVLFVVLSWPFLFVVYQLVVPPTGQRCACVVCTPSRPPPTTVRLVPPLFPWTRCSRCSPSLAGPKKRFRRVQLDDVICVGVRGLIYGKEWVHCGPY